MTSRRVRQWVVFWGAYLWSWWCQITVANAGASLEVYLPLAVGNRWVYESSEGSEAAPALESWEVVRQDRRSFVIQVRQPFITFDGIEEVVALEPDQIWHSVQSAASVRSQILLKVPLTLGAGWQDPDGGRSTVTGVALSVTTPAGTFIDCVEITRWRKATETKLISLYAPGVGMVQREETFAMIYGGPSGDLVTPAKGRVLLRLKEWRVQASSAEAQHR